MTTPRYATNAFTNFAQYEAGVFSAGEEQKVIEGDNPDFIWPDKTLLNAPMGTRQPVQRGYMRMIADGFSKTPRNLNRRRLHFQFNPDNITRSVTARNDVQMWMNQDPIQLTQAVPGDANFSFELMFNREAEVNSATYRTGNGTTATSDAKAVLPIDNPGAGNPTTLSASAVTDIGVLADLIVFDELIGQGVNSQLIDQILSNAKKKANLERTAALKAAQSNVPTSTASAKVTSISSSGKITKIKVEGGGSGYVSAPFVQVTGGAGKGTGEFTAVVDTKAGKVTAVKIEDGGTGSGYLPTDLNKIKVSFIGGGTGGNTTSSKSTSDAQDQIPPKFDDAAATQALTANYGNSAFLVSTPVRIVFSSLFMVEGYITATQVTFNKFNPNMVPTQCLVGITMQALYIGFARDKTYLTKTLKEALETADTEGDLDTPTNTPDANEQAALKSLSKNLFKKISSASGYSYDNLNKAGVGVILGDDQKDTIGFRVTASDELKNLQAGGTNKIDTMSQDVTIRITYKGNSNPAITNNWPVGQRFRFENVASNWNDDDFGRDSPQDTLKCDMVLKAGAPISSKKIKTAGWDFDTSTTSKWDYEIVVKTFVTPASGSGGFWAKQVIKATKKNVNWDAEFDFYDILTLAVEP